jgi:hypothetical protein
MKFHLRRAATALFVVALGVSPVANAALVSRNILKTFFQTGDVPTQQQFATLIDSMVNISEDGDRLNLYFDYGPTVGDHTVSLGRAWLFAQSSDGNLINFQSGRSIGPASLEQVLVKGGLLGASSLWAGQSGFLGLQFELVDAGIISTHYGFVQMSVDDASSLTPYAIHVDGFAYETTANTSITASSVVPVPAAFWLFGSGLLGLIGMTHRKAA